MGWVGGWVGGGSEKLNALGTTGDDGAARFRTIVTFCTSNGGVPWCSVHDMRAAHCHCNGKLAVAKQWGHAAAPAALRRRPQQSATTENKQLRQGRNRRNALNYTHTRTLVKNNETMPIWHCTGYHGPTPMPHASILVSNSAHLASRKSTRATKGSPP